MIVTAFLLASTHLIKKGNKTITFGRAFIIGIAQAFAVLPGISRSGATIATGLLLKTKKDEVARFSFLMVLIPILGAAFLDIIGGDISSNESIGAIPMVLLPILGAAFLDIIGGDLTSNESIGAVPMLVGFVTAFISGLLACSWMIKIVRRGKLIYFAIYCFIIGLIAIFAA